MKTSVLSKTALLALTLSAGVFSCAVASDAATAPSYSRLWGVNGELWNPQSRIPDFSFAGYHAGEAPIPHPAVVANVRDFGATGDGKTDDTAAFVKAIAATENGALLIPAGRYVITDILTVAKSNIVLRGAGPDKTFLVCPKPLEKMKPNPSHTTSGIATSNYSWSGGILWLNGKSVNQSLGKIAQNAARGTRIIELENQNPNVKAGQMIEITQHNSDDNSLVDYLYGGQPGDIKKLDNQKIKTTFVSKVTAVAGSRITLQRPLFTDIRPQWKADAAIFQPGVSEVGVENLAFEFPATPYQGHFTEQGYNPLAMNNAANCWARNLKFINADSGPFIGGDFITLDNLVFETQRTPDKTGATGHHGVSLGADCLLTHFDIRQKFIHDISVTKNGGNVIMNGEGVDLALDHHRKYPYANLFTAIDLGKGTRMFKSGGGSSLGKHSGAWETFWNIRAQQAQQWPDADFGPDLMTFVGVTTNAPSVRDENGRWWESIAPAQLSPANLYEAQLQRRLQAEKTR